MANLIILMRCQMKCLLDPKDGCTKDFSSSSKGTTVDTEWLQHRG